VNSAMMISLVGDIPLEAVALGSNLRISPDSKIFLKKRLISEEA